MDQQFQAYTAALAELAPCVQINRESDAAVILPALLVGSRVTYQALPLHRELDPFLAVLGDGRAFAGRIGKGLPARLAHLRAPARVKVYITPHCPFCPEAVATLLGLAAWSDRIRVTIIDGERFGGTAAKDKVSSAPTVILDDRLRWTGSVNADELTALMLDRDPANLGASALQGMIEDGDAQGLAAMMVERGTLFKAFLDLLVHPRWSVRLGAMVVVEELYATAPDLGRKMIDAFWSRFDTVSDQAKGDFLFLCAEVGESTHVPRIQAVLQREVSNSVREAAAEALQKLK